MEIINLQGQRNSGKTTVFNIILEKLQSDSHFIEDSTYLSVIQHQIIKDHIAKTTTPIRQKEKREDFVARFTNLKNNSLVIYSIGDYLNDIHYIISEAHKEDVLVIALNTTFNIHTRVGITFDTANTFYQNITQSQNRKTYNYNQALTLYNRIKMLI